MSVPARLFAVMSIAGAGASPLFAQTYPDRPIRLIVPIAAGHEPRCVRG